MSASLCSNRKRAYDASHMRKNSPSPPATVLAAQYLRMSTERQEYSMENQKAAIDEYAQRHGLAVVQTYSDAGKSGLVLRRRAGLSRLLQDVVGGTAAYKAILVYDVSRWGRFQDVDEAAHYEFLCRNAGIPVHYCAEQFANDGTLPASILKALKRTMAAEFSRELGVKVCEGKKRLTRLGFWMGGSPGYGLRRMLMSADGERKQELVSGEYKSLTTDRIILVPGPKKEVEHVRSMYATVLRERKGPTQIAHSLNQRGVPYREGKLWEDYSVRRVLTNPKYIGCNLWGQTSGKLHGPRLRLAPEYWISKAGAFAPIIGQDTFDRVQAVLRKKSEKKSDRELLQRLGRLLVAKGRLTETIIDEARALPSHSTYRHRFGSVRRAYELVGYPTLTGVYERCDKRKRTQRLRDQLVEQIRALSPEALTVFHLPGRLRPILRLGNDRRVSVIVCRARRSEGKGRRWVLSPIPEESGHITLLALLNSTNDGFHSFVLFPRIDKVREYRFADDDSWLDKGTRLGEISDFYQAAKRLASPQ